MMIEVLVEEHNKRLIQTIDSFLMQSVIAVHRDTQFSHVHVLLNR